MVAGRVLGGADYGALAALLGALTVVLLPTGAVQLAVSREISRRLAGGDLDGATAFAWACFRAGALATVPLTAAAFALVVPVGNLLRIESTAAVAIAAAGLSAAFVFPVALGVLQGWQRFHSVALLYVLPFGLRIVLLAGVVWLGFRLGGAVYAAIGGGIVAAAVAATLIEEPLRRGARAVRPSLRPFLRYLGPVVLGLIGIAVLTNADVLVVKARFPADAAGDYAAASAFARVAFFIPAALLAVLFPRTAARQARGEETGDILGRSLLVTVAFGGLLAVAYWMFGRGLVHTSFGPEFAEAGLLLPEFAVAMTLYALANVLVGFHLSRGETRYAWLLAAAVPAQLVVLAIVPGGLEGVILANAAVAALLIAAHELAVGSSAGAVREGIRRLRSEITLPRVAVREGAAAAAGFVAVACWLTWPLAPNLGSAFLGSVGADASGTIWWLWHLQQEGAYHVFGSTHHVLNGAPLGYPEANGLNLQWLLPYYPGYLATALVGEVAAYNLVVLGGFVLSAVAMYALARYLGCTPIVAAWAGLVYLVFPAHFARNEHASLLHFEVLALALLAAAAASARPSATRLALVAAATVAAWLTSGYFGVMAVIGMIAFAFAAALVSPGWRLRVAAGIAGAAIVATIAVGSLSLAGSVRAGELRERETGDLVVYGLRPDELVVPGRNLVLGDRLDPFHEARTHGANPSEQANYLGLLTIALALGALVVAWRRRRELDARVRTAAVGLPAVVVVALLFATPSPVEIFGRSVTWTPSRLLWEVVGEFRVPSRWTAMAMTALIPLAALGLQAAWTAVNARRGRVAAAALALAAMAFSIGELAYPLGDKVTAVGEIPTEYAALQRIPSGVLAEYPLKKSDVFNFWQREHGRPLVNGAPTNTYADEVARAVSDPGAAGTAATLSLLGVTAIVTHPNALDLETTDGPDGPAASWGPGYALVGRFGDGTSVWRVTAEPAPALPSLPSESFYFPVVHDDGSLAYPLTGKTGQLELRSDRARVVRLAFDAWPVGATSELRLAGAEGEVLVPLAGRTPVSVVVRLPAGRSRLDLRVEPTPESGMFPLEISALRTERTGDAPALVAGR